MIRIAICDDDCQVCRQLEEHMNNWGEAYDIEYEIFTSGIEFEEALKERYFDLIFLDVIMKDRSGIELGKLIRDKLGNDTSRIVYISAYGSEHALELFQFQPFQFLKKPVDPEAFRNVFYKACDKIQGEDGIFEFKAGRTIYRIPLAQIRYFEGDNRRVRIVTGEKIYHCYSTIENLFSKINMEQAGFIRLHKSYAVNLRYVASFSVRSVTLFDGAEFTVSALFRENAIRQYETYKEKLKMGKNPAGNKESGHQRNK